MTDILEPALPWDILREIAFICPRETCATLMRTCAFFKHEAAASILGREIQLFDKQTTAGFLKFLHAGNKPRYPCVRHLTLGFHDYFPLTPDNANALANAIPLMAGLVVARIVCAEWTLGKWPAIGDAIASLPSLRQISLMRAGLRSWQLLFSLRSAKLRSIEFQILAHSGADEGLSTRQSLGAPSLSSHPVQIFGRWSSTLTELAYQCVYAPAAHDALPCYPEVYPMMRTLYICHCIGRVDPTPYIRAFPNLAHLQVKTLLHKGVHEYRTSIAHSQREVQRGGPASHQPGQWRELIQFNGSLVDLYALALNCRISHIRLAHCTYDIDLPLLRAVLADARPLHLNIYWLTRSSQHTRNILPPILQTQGASRLQSLVISCKIGRCISHEDVASALVSTIVLGQLEGTLVYLSRSSC